MPRVLRILVALVLSVAAAALAQRRFDDFGGYGYGRVPAIHNIPYDGRFTFVRIKYETAPGGYWAGGRPSWVHGYPIAEEHLMRIMNDISYLGPHTDDANVLTLDDPELFKYPIAYIIEVGWWTLSDREATALRTYIQKGGFVIVDDYEAAFLDVGAQRRGLAVRERPPADLDDVRDRILEQLRIIEREDVRIVCMRPEVADVVHDPHQVLLGDGIAVHPRGPAARPVATRRRLVLDADEREPAVVRDVVDRRHAPVAVAAEVVEAALRQRGGGDTQHERDEDAQHTGHRIDPTLGRSLRAT